LLTKIITLETEGWKFEWEETDDTPDFIRELIAQCCAIDPAACPSVSLALLIIGNLQMNI